MSVVDVRDCVFRQVAGRADVCVCYFRSSLPFEDGLEDNATGFVVPFCVHVLKFLASACDVVASIGSAA